MGIINDTLILSLMNVVDYSLLVGVNEENVRLKSCIQRRMRLLWVSSIISDVMIL